MQAYVNSTLDPCDNFYEYVCSAEIDRHRASKKHRSWSVLSDMQQRIQKDFEEVISYTHVPTSPKDAATPSEKAGVTYRLCLVRHSAAAYGTAAVKDLLAKLGINSWPLWPPSRAAPAWTSIVAKMPAAVGFTAVVALEPVEDIDDPSRRILKMYGPYFERMPWDAVKLVDAPEAESYKEYAKEVVRFMNRSVSAVSSSVAEQMVSLEFELAIRTRSLGPTTAVNATFRRKKIRDLQNDDPQTNWLQFLDQAFAGTPVSFDEDEEVLVESNFYDIGIPYLRQSSRYTTTVYNYIGFVVLDRIGIDAAGTLDGLKKAFVRKVPQLSAPQGDRCVLDLLAYAPDTAFRLYIDQKFDTAVTKQVSDLADSVSREFRAMLGKDGWLDADTRSEALQKINNTAINVGYPNRIMQEYILNKEFADVNFSRAHYVTVKARLMVNSMLSRMRVLRLPYDRTQEWIGGVDTVIPRSNPLFNFIQLSAGMLQQPFYESQLPMSLNMGATGAAIGREITHIIHGLGGDYDAAGQRRDWWTNDSKAELEKKNACFLAIYDNITDEETGVQLDGNLTVIEDMVDSGGLAMAFEAYSTYLGSNSDYALPGLDNTTNEQMFFITNAMGFCDLRADEELVHAITHGPYALNKYRVNVPMGNLGSFSDAFQCPEGSPMNFKNKCSLW